MTGELLNSVLYKIPFLRSGERVVTFLTSHVHGEGREVSQSFPPRGSGWRQLPQHCTTGKAGSLLTKVLDSIARIAKVWVKGGDSRFSQWRVIQTGRHEVKDIVRRAISNISYLSHRAGDWSIFSWLNWVRSRELVWSDEVGRSLLRCDLILEWLYAGGEVASQSRSSAGAEQNNSSLKLILCETDKWRQIFLCIM